MPNGAVEPAGDRAPACLPQVRPAGLSLAAPEGVIDRDQAVCPSCGQEAEAVVLERDGKIILRTLCRAHPGVERMVLSDSRLYWKLEEWNRRVFESASARSPQAVDDEVPDKAPLLAVLDITNRCNLACTVCFADVDNRDTYFLEIETVGRMLRALAEHRPVPCHHVQFSGGEPTLHPQFLDILRLSRSMGFNHIQAATNGIRFTDLDFARRCEDAGLETLYLQFDGMNDETYLALRGQRLLDRKLRAFENITRTNMRVVMVPTFVAGVNVDQIGPVFRFALEHSRHVTGISAQPMAAVGRFNIPRAANGFNLSDLALEFGRQTGLTRFPEDWLPLNALTLLTRGIARLRGEVMLNPACDAHCSLGTYFHVDEHNRPTCLTQFLDLERMLASMDKLQVPPGAGALRRRISGLGQLKVLSDCFDKERAPRGLNFLRLLRGLDGWEDKSVGRGRTWFRRGFNGMFFAGMHFMDASTYKARRVRRCIIKQVTADGSFVSFCRYNAGERRVADGALAEGSRRASPACACGVDPATSPGD